jgi:transposase-like protein
MTRHQLKNIKQPGEVTPRRAARILGVHEETVYRWCKDAVDEDKGHFRGAARRSVVNWYYIKLSAVEATMDKVDTRKNGR